VNDHVVFTKNPSYWGKDLTASQLALQPVFDSGHFNTVVIRFKADDVARYTDLTTGASQVSTILSSDWNLIQANPDKFSYVTTPPGAEQIQAIGINTQLYPTNITAVRQAIVHAINYTDIIQKAFFGQLTPFVGPEYQAWSQFYDLGKYPQYSYNLTLAKQYLVQANVKNMPPLTFNAVSGCQYCTTIAELVQSNLAQIGITVNIEIIPLATWYSTYGSYSGELQSVAGGLTTNLQVEGPIGWYPGSITPAEPWVSFVSNRSLLGNNAIYSNPIVENAVNAFLNSADTNYIQAQVAKAQTQIYNDAPYAWLGIQKLWLGGGSQVFLKGTIKSYYLDPLWAGQSDELLFNTIIM
jgi:ABC-type transport system substrate-binding protein